MYYCKSRFYVPKLRRWLNADSFDYLEPENIEGVNLFAYCANDPVNMYDPEGNLALFIVSAIIGAVLGFGIAAYMDYQDDGEVFNGSVKWYDYVGATVVGGLTGAAVGELVSMAFSTSIPTVDMFQFGGTILAGVSSTTAVSLSGNCILSAAAVGTIYMLSKGSGARIGHNQYENKQFRDLSKKYKLNKKQQEILHRIISKRGFSYEEIERLIIELFF